MHSLIRQAYLKPAKHLWGSFFWEKGDGIKPLNNFANNAIRSVLHDTKYAAKSSFIFVPSVSGKDKQKEKPSDVKESGYNLRLSCCLGKLFYYFYIFQNYVLLNYILRSFAMQNNNRCYYRPVML